VYDFNLEHIENKELIRITNFKELVAYFQI
jgi:hypothetical protein